MGNIPEGGELVGRVGIINSDGPTGVRLRLGRTTTGANIIRTLPFNTHVQVIKRFADGWYFVSTPWGELGFVASSYVWTHLPEPTARLHRVQPNITGTAIAIAETYYGDEADQWGQDLRFYVSVLAHSNRIAIPAGTDGWRHVHFKAGTLIWIPGRAHAQAMQDVLNSGSLSYELFRSLTAPLQRIDQLSNDLRQAILLSGRYLGDAVRKRVTQALISTLLSLAELVVGAAAIMIVTTVTGAAIGAFFGGVGAAPGAAIGFEVGLIILEWLGLGMLVAWVAESLKRLGTAFWNFINTVWNARGDRGSIDRAARQFAEAIADLLGTALEALLMFAAARGVSATVNALRGTAFGRRFGESRMGEWLDARLDNFRDGRGWRPREVLARFYRRVEIVDGTGKPVGEFDGIDMSGKKFIEYKAARNISKTNPRTGRPQQTPVDWAEKQIFKKTQKRITELFDPATQTRPGPGGSSRVPSIQELRGVRRFQFHIDGNTPALRSAVAASLLKLRQTYPGWNFEARYGVNIHLPLLPEEFQLNHGTQ